MRRTSSAPQAIAAWGAEEGLIVLSHKEAAGGGAWAHHRAPALGRGLEDNKQKGRVFGTFICRPAAQDGVDVSKKI
jgi:peptidoglycan/xylan/chitin deacetylase (PgdA/CDA1 family)